MKIKAYVLFSICDDVNVIFCIQFVSSACVWISKMVECWNFFFKDNFNLWCLLLIIVFYYQTKIPLDNDWNLDLLFETKKILLIELTRIHFCVYVYAKLWDICLSHLAIWHTKWHKNFFFFLTISYINF